MRVISLGLGTGDGIDLLARLCAAYHCCPIRITNVNRPPKHRPSGGGIAAVGSGNEYLAALPRVRFEKDSGLVATPVFVFLRLLRCIGRPGATASPARSLCGFFFYIYRGKSPLGDGRRLRCARQGGAARGPGFHCCWSCASRSGWKDLVIPDSRKPAVTTQDCVSSFKEVRKSRSLRAFHQGLDLELSTVLRIETATSRPNPGYPSAVTLSSCTMGPTSRRAKRFIE